MRTSPQWPKPASSRVKAPFHFAVSSREEVVIAHTQPSPMCMYVCNITSLMRVPKHRVQWLRVLERYNGARRVAINTLVERIMCGYGADPSPGRDDAERILA